MQKVTIRKVWFFGAIEISNRYFQHVSQSEASSKAHYHGRTSYGMNHTIYSTEDKFVMYDPYSSSDELSDEGKVFMRTS